MADEPMGVSETGVNIGQFKPGIAMEDRFGCIAGGHG